MFDHISVSYQPGSYAIFDGRGIIEGVATNKLSSYTHNEGDIPIMKELRKSSAQISIVEWFNENANNLHNVIEE